MLDRVSEDLPRLVQLTAGIEHVVDLGPVLGPLLDLVEVAVVRDDRIVGFFVLAHLFWRAAGECARFQLAETLFSYPACSQKSLPSPIKKFTANIR
jgi:hypothetical protein